MFKERDLKRCESQNFALDRLSLSMVDSNDDNYDDDVRSLQFIFNLLVSFPSQGSQNKPP